MKGKNSNPSPRLLRLKVASSYLSLSGAKLRQLIRAGVLPVIQLEPRGPWLVDIRDLDHYVDINKHTL